MNHYLQLVLWGGLAWLVLFLLVGLLINRGKARRDR